MTINPAAIADFLDMPRANSDKAKRFTDAALDRKLAALDPQPDFVHPPYRHQKIAFLLNLKYGSYFDILYPGLGKSKTALDVFRYRKKLGESHRLLVLVPGVANVGGWEEQCAEHAPDLSFVGLDETLRGSDARREAVLDLNYDVVCATYVGWLRLITTTKTKRRRTKDGQREFRGWSIVEKKARELERMFDEVVFDESDLLRNSQSLIFRSARRLRKKRHVTPMTGTAFGSSPMGLWGQMYIADGGASLGKTLGLFRAVFFNEKKNPFSGGVDYEFDKRMEDDLYHAMRHRSITFTDEECLDLPKKVGGVRKPMVRRVVLPKETWAYYERLVEEFQEARGNFQLMKGAYVRMRRLESGYLSVLDPEGDRHEIVFKDNPKLDALVEWLRELPPHKNAIVFVEYQITGRLVVERLRKEKIKHVRLYGKTRGKNKVVARFKKTKGLHLITSRSGARGHNFQHASHHMAFYESPDSPDVRMQAERRIFRAGQTRRSFYWDFIVVGGISERILKSLGVGQALIDRLATGDETL